MSRIYTSQQVYVILKFPAPLKLRPYDAIQICLLLLLLERNLVKKSIDKITKVLVLPIIVHHAALTSV